MIFYIKKERVCLPFSYYVKKGDSRECSDESIFYTDLAQFFQGLSQKLSFSIPWPINDLLQLLPLSRIAIFQMREIVSLAIICIKHLHCRLLKKSMKSIKNESKNIEN